MALGGDGLTLVDGDGLAGGVGGGFFVHVEIFFHVGFDDLPEFGIEPGHALDDAIAGMVGGFIPL